MLAIKNMGTYGDMIMGALELLQQDHALLERERKRARFILIDEFQDSNIAQIELAQLLAGGERNVFAVGDPDQAIYRFRGASSAAFDEFAARFPETRLIVFDRNQRSTSAVLNCAHAVIERNPPVACVVAKKNRFDRQALSSDRERRARGQARPLTPEAVNLVTVAGAQE